MAGLIRVAIIVILALLLYRFVSRWLKTLEQNKRRHTPDSGKVENMVRCEFCNVHLPQNEAVHHDGHWYCNEKHFLQSKQKH